MQKESQKNYKLVKLKSETVDLLDKEIERLEQRQPYLKGSLSYNAIVQMLLFKNKIKLSKKRYLVVQE